MSNLIQIKVAELNQLNPLMIAEDNRVEQKFIQMYNAIWGTAKERKSTRKRNSTSGRSYKTSRNSKDAHHYPSMVAFGYSGQRPVT